MAEHKEIASQVVGSTDDAREPRSFHRIGWRVVLFLVSFALFLWDSLVGITVFDEGFVVTGAALILQGGLFYRDFFSLYGPGHFYLTAGAFALFGENLFVARVLHAAILAGLAVLVFELSRIAADRRGALPVLMVLAYGGIVLFVRPNVGYPAIAATLPLLVAVLVFGTWMQYQRRSALVAASALIGLAGVMRWDFGAFGLVALMSTLVVVLWRTGPMRSNWRLILSCAVGPALGIMSVGYFPFIMLPDPARWFNEVVVYSLFEFPKWRNYEYLRPTYWILAKGWDGARIDLLVEAALRVAYVVLPVALPFAIFALLFLSVRRRERALDARLLQFVMLGAVTLLLFHQMRVRSVMGQGFPAIVASLPLIPYVFCAILDAPKYGRLRAIIGTAAFILLALLWYLAGDNIDNASRAVPLETPRAQGVSLDPRQDYSLSGYAELVSYIRSRTAEGEAIYSGVLDHSRLYLNDCILYFLADRPPADRFVELEPGIANTRSGQQEIIKALSAKSVRLVVLMDLVSNEPNLTALSNGITDLDEFLRAHFRPTRTFGRYTVMEVVP